MKNNRRKMEDRHALCVDVNSLFSLKVSYHSSTSSPAVSDTVLLCAQDVPYQSYYAVYDGHNGVEAAYYAAIHVLPNIVRHPEFASDLSKAIKEGIKTTDDRFCRTVSSIRSDLKQLYNNNSN